MNFFTVQMKIRNFLQLIAIFCLTAFFSSGCATDKEAEKPHFPLAGTLWAPVSGPRGAILEFTADHRMVGTTGFNRFFAPIEKIDGNLINFGNIAVTRAMSPEPEKEAVFIVFRLPLRLPACRGLSARWYRGSASPCLRSGSSAACGSPLPGPYPCGRRCGRG